MAHAKAHFFGSRPPGALGMCQISVNLNHKVNFNDFQTKLCVSSTIERYKTYQTGFSFRHLGHAPRVGLVGTMGGLKTFSQIQRVSYLHEWHMQQHNFRVPASWGWAKRSNIIKSQLQSQFRRFLN